MSKHIKMRQYNFIALGSMLSCNDGFSTILIFSELYLQVMTIFYFKQVIILMCMPGTSEYALTPPKEHKAFKVTGKTISEIFSTKKTSVIQLRIEILHRCDRESVV